MNIIIDQVLNCDHCNNQINYRLSWSAPTLYVICKNCNKETKYQFKDWKLTNSKKL